MGKASDRTGVLGSDSSNTNHGKPKAAMVIPTAAKTTSGVGHLFPKPLETKRPRAKEPRGRDLHVVYIKRPRVWRTPVAANIPFPVNERAKVYQTLRRTKKARSDSAWLHHRSFTHRKALFWLGSALHKRADHAARSSVGRLKRIVGETCHRCTSLRIAKRSYEGNTQANKRQIAQQMDEHKHQCCVLKCVEQERGSTP